MGRVAPPAGYRRMALRVTALRLYPHIAPLRHGEVEDPDHLGPTDRQFLPRAIQLAGNVRACRQRKAGRDSERYGRGAGNT